MHQPVTDNPFVIMVINMVIVFAVLTAIWGLIELTHLLDPTKKKAEPPASAPAAPAPAPAAPVAPAVPTGLSTETVAVIAAAVTACGYSAEQIHAIRPAEQPAWRNFGRTQGMRTPR
ncbi:methylmalonyl-CoA decarboxylase [Selenomonas sp. oral taxon 920]|uniref:OadG family protein n=1 Tax=Selenomonas sp. oral taxon 920 TaxID=1884263 RepID=UPI000840DED1|nr:OadG family protein [Selenomonas sp. oral taxon 920]AOH48829.1 methylmalonyl-CoA decarboxylase [Selenomonas sp. oral taxon 920]